jgi:hypothetical protein
MNTSLEAVSSREQTRQALRDSLDGTVKELKLQLAQAESQTVTQGDREAWAAQMALLMTSFTQEVRRTIAAVEEHERISLEIWLTQGDAQRTY